MESTIVRGIQDFQGTACTQNMNLISLKQHIFLQKNIKFISTLTNTKIAKKAY